jgi:hypothetical protein
MLGPIQMRSEVNPLICDLPQGRQAENLKPPTICKNRPLPVHEFVKPLGLADNSHAGSQVEVVCIGEDNLRSQPRDLIRSHRLYSGLSPNRHKGRGMNLPPRCINDTKTSLAFR